MRVSSSDKAPHYCRTYFCDRRIVRGSRFSACIVIWRGTALLKNVSLCSTDSAGVPFSAVVSHPARHRTTSGPTSVIGG